MTSGLFLLDSTLKVFEHVGIEGTKEAKGLVTSALRDKLLRTGFVRPHLISETTERTAPIFQKNIEYQARKAWQALLCQYFM